MARLSSFAVVAQICAKMLLLGAFLLAGLGLTHPVHAIRKVTENNRGVLSPRAMQHYQSSKQHRVAAAAGVNIDEDKWIEVRLATQQLIAWEHGRAVMSTAISSGTRATPTVKGQFRIGRKFASIRMRGADYDLPNVPYAMFFHRDYAIHGTYWHTSFGRPMSHGCVNMPTDRAGWLYAWAAPGTLVVVH
jgi:lipoprotein-anchoring transpeptidase ErfK/SrfK